MDNDEVSPGTSFVQGNYYDPQIRGIALRRLIAALRPSISDSVQTSVQTALTAAGAAPGGEAFGAAASGFGASSRAEEAALKTYAPYTREYAPKFPPFGGSGGTSTERTATMKSLDSEIATLTKERGKLQSKQSQYNPDPVKAAQIAKYDEQITRKTAQRDALRGQVAVRAGYRLPNELQPTTAPGKNMGRVKVMAPNGSIGTVSSDKLDAALAKGFKLVK